MLSSSGAGPKVVALLRRLTSSHAIPSRLALWTLRALMLGLRLLLCARRGYSINESPDGQGQLHLALIDETVG